MGRTFAAIVRKQILKDSVKLQIMRENIQNDPVAAREFY